MMIHNALQKLNIPSTFLLYSGHLSSAKGSKDNAMKIGMKDGQEHWQLSTAIGLTVLKAASSIALPLGEIQIVLGFHTMNRSQPIRQTFKKI